MNLLSLLFPPRRSERTVEEATVEALVSKLAPMPVGNTIALLPFRDPLVHACVVETKYYGNEKATKLLGAVLAEYVLDRLSEDNALEKRKTVFVPIPLSKKRKRERGYNQTEAVCEAAALPETECAPHLLSRVRHTSPQTGLGRAGRLKNVADAFQAGAVDPAHLYIVVDDVITTGATLGEAEKALEHAGALHVMPVALAH